MNLKDLEDYLKNQLEKIKTIDKKLELFGLTEEQVTRGRQYLIDQEVEPNFTRLAISLKNGMYYIYEQ